MLSSFNLSASLSLHKMRFYAFFGFLALTFTAAASPLTLEEARRLAESVNPTLRSAIGKTAVVEGERADSLAFLWNNPQIALEKNRRTLPPLGSSGGEERQREWSAGIAQSFEIAGQQGHRRDAAEQEVVAVRASVAETRRQVRAEVEQRFARVLALQMRIATEEDALRLVEDAATTVGKRVAAGEDSRLDGNLATVEAERGNNQLAALREQLTAARADLASVLQLPPDRLPEAVGELAPSPRTYTLQQLLAAAERRPQLQALQARETSAASRLALERAAVFPDVTLGISVGREGAMEAREKIVGVTLSVPLPLFRRNATGIGRASSELTQAQIERQAASRDVPAQVRALWLNVESLKARVQRLEANILARLDQNQRLSTKSYRAGEIGLLQLIVVNRQVLDGRRDLIDARTELRLATIALEAAAGWPAQGDTK